MFNYKAVLCAISSLLIASSPAKADLQFTKWEISAPQVQKASPQTVSEDFSLRYQALIDNLVLCNRLGKNLDQKYSQNVILLEEKWNTLKNDQRLRNISGGMYLGTAIEFHSGVIETIGKYDFNSIKDVEFKQIIVSGIFKNIERATSTTDTFLKLQSLPLNMLSMNSFCQQHPTTYTKYCKK